MFLRVKWVGIWCSKREATCTKLGHLAWGQWVVFNQVLADSLWRDDTCPFAYPLHCLSLVFFKAPRYFQWKPCCNTSTKSFVQPHPYPDSFGTRSLHTFTSQFAITDAWLLQRSKPDIIIRKNFLLFLPLWSIPQQTFQKQFLLFLIWTLRKLWWFLTFFEGSFHSFGLIIW